MLRYVDFYRLACAWRRATSVVVAGSALALFSACVTPTTFEEGESERWQYGGAQRVPSVVSIEGTLVVNRRSGDRFEGSLDVRRANVLGQVERVVGVVAGRRTDTTLDFEVTLDGSIVRHIGRVDGDRVSGTWLDDAGFGAALVSGEFTMVRVP